MSSAIHGGFFHVSVHDQTYGFHIKAEDGSSREPRRLPYPSEIRPGARRYLEIRMPLAAVCRDAPRRPDRIKWYRPPEEPNVWATFHVLVHAQDIDDPKWWTRGAAQFHVGETALADGSTLIVLASVMPGFDGEFTGHSESPNGELLRELARKGEAGALLMGRNRDESAWFLDLPSLNRATEGVPPSAARSVEPRISD
jgi:hypothetical protein